MMTNRQDVDTNSTLAERVAGVRERMAAAARRAGRRPEEITLVAASKTWAPEVVCAAYRAGVRVFGENRVEEAAEKAHAVAVMLAKEAEITTAAELPAWHMIGHVQSRKARAVLPWASMVHSVDGARLAGRLAQAAEAEGVVLPVLLEVNISGEESKYGLRPAGVPEVVEAILALPALRLEGLMTMAPVAEDAEQARPIFRGLRDLHVELARHFPRVAWKHLSMGMSADFEAAIEEGATMVRIGSAIFGERYCAIR